MRARRVRLVVVVSLLAAVSAVGLSSAPASAPGAMLALSSAPAAVTAGNPVAYSASITNTSGSMWTQLVFTNPAPTAGSEAASFLQASCSGSMRAGAFACRAGRGSASQLAPGQTATVTVVWRSPAVSSGLVNAPHWTIKSKTVSKPPVGPNRFEPTPVVTQLLDDEDPNRAGTFATAACTDASSPTLTTNPDLGPGNPLATSVCAPNVPTVPVTGLAASIDEEEPGQQTDRGITQVSVICIPAPGADCDDSPFTFSPLATFTFRIDNTQLPPVCVSSLTSSASNQYGGYGGCKLRKISKVYDDGALVSSSPGADPRVVSITFDKQTKTTTIIVRSSENGRWDFE